MNLLQIVLKLTDNYNCKFNKIISNFKIITSIKRNFNSWNFKLKCNLSNTDRILCRQENTVLFYK